MDISNDRTALVVRRAGVALGGAVLSAIALGWGGAARAELPPYIYEQARAAAADVVVLKVGSIEGPDDASEGRGSCRVSGRIEAVERGVRWTAGEPATFAVACVTAAYRPMPGPFQGYDVERLRKVERLRVWADGDLVVRRGLDAVETPVTRP